jgi:hypothetical protein
MKSHDAPGSRPESGVRNPESEPAAQLLRPALFALCALACIYTYRLESPDTRTRSATGITRLAAISTNGKIDVTASHDTLIAAVVTRFAYGRDRADAERALGNVTVTDTVVGDQYRISADMPTGPRPYGAFYVIAAPESTALELSTTNGTVSVSGMTRGVRATTTNGAVTLTATHGDAELQTTNGALEVSGHYGSIDASTTNGPIVCDLAEFDADQSAGLSTTNSEVELFLPDNVSALIDVTTTNGDIRLLDFSFTYEGTPTRDHVRARIGSGAAPVTISTTNGDVTVRRR